MQGARLHSPCCSDVALPGAARQRLVRSMHTGCSSGLPTRHDLQSANSFIRVISEVVVTGAQDKYNIAIKIKFDANPTWVPRFGGDYCAGQPVTLLVHGVWYITRAPGRSIWFRYGRQGVAEHHYLVPSSGCSRMRFFVYKTSHGPCLSCCFRAISSATPAACAVIPFGVDRLQACGECT